MTIIAVSSSIVVPMAVTVLLNIVYDDDEDELPCEVQAARPRSPDVGVPGPTIYWVLVTGFYLSYYNWGL